MRYINCAYPEVREVVVRLVQYIFENRKDRWEELLKTGQVVSFIKKENATIFTTTGESVS